MQPDSCTLYATRRLRVETDRNEEDGVLDDSVLNDAVRKEVVYEGIPREDVWAALTDADQLESWFANEVALDLRPGGGASFRWGNGEERHATITEVDPEHRLALQWDDDGEVEFTLEEVDEGTRLLVRESTPQFATALELRAMAYAHA
jgi:uncharacterized protein YndB with AHSA1/START domain